MRTLNNWSAINYLNNELPKLFHLEIVNVVCTKKELSSKYNLIFLEEKEVDKVVSACISLMIEVSLADQSIDESEIESLKKTLSNKFNIEEAQISSLISAGKESQEESTSSSMSGRGVTPVTVLSRSFFLHPLR